MDDKRKLRLLALGLALAPILAGLGIVALAHFAGNEGEAGLVRIEPNSNSSVPAERAPAPAPAGALAPAIHLFDGSSGNRFDPAALTGHARAVVFLSTRCGAAGTQLRQALEGAAAGSAVLAISADPWHDTIPRVRGWLRHHDEPPSFHYLLGNVERLRPYWRAWGLAEPKRGDGAAACTGIVPVHLVSGSGVNAGVVDLGGGASGADLARDLTALEG